VADTIGQPWPQLESSFCSFFAPQSWYNVDDCGQGQNTTIEGQMLGKKAKNSTKYIKQLYPSINRE